jgi:hypothetical protein
MSSTVAVVAEKGKRGRKRKEICESDARVIVNKVIEEAPIQNDVEKILKKRGRKPKGGKIILKPELNELEPAIMSNVILHLKCGLSDISSINEDNLNIDPSIYIPTIPSEIKTYNTEKNGLFYSYNENNIIEKKTNTDGFKPLCNYYESSIAYNKKIEYSNNNNTENNNTVLCGNCKNNIEIDNTKIKNNDNTDDDMNMNDIMDKVKNIKMSLYKNTLNDKKSACFWCTYTYDNIEVYIPKYQTDDSITGYGSFCRPECAVAFLMKENIDDSVKFERYHLLNQTYGKIYNYKRNIKPAPNPYYLLEKFYGNLSIQEYRHLLKTGHMLLVIDKPMTRVLPELHEDNDEFINSVYGNVNGNGNKNVNENVNKPSCKKTTQSIYKVKKSTDKHTGPSKSSIIKDHFGVV